jgi:hypothetical protein
MHDRDIRPHLRTAVRAAHPDAILFEEFPLCRRGRADLAAVNASLHGFEIKSEHDSLNRLPLQIPYYDAIFDFSEVVSAKRHLRYVERVVPEHWGIRSVSSGVENPFEVIRKPKRNELVNRHELARLLWKSEAIRILRSRQIKISSGTPVITLWGLLGDLSVRELASVVRDALKDRRAKQSEKSRTQCDDSLPIEPIAEVRRVHRHSERVG